MRLLYGAPPRPTNSWSYKGDADSAPPARTPFAPEPNAPPSVTGTTTAEALLASGLRRLGRLRMAKDLNTSEVRAELDALAGELLSLQALQNE
jgi:hypothetical protein